MDCNRFQSHTGKFLTNFVLKLFVEKRRNMRRKKDMVPAVRFEFVNRLNILVTLGFGL